MTRDIALPVNATIEQLDQIPISSVQSFKEVAQPWYSDQVLPFDITLAAANEYGAAASCKIFGVEILNEGFGSSIDDSVLEQQATFVARNVSPLQAVGRTSLLVVTRSSGRKFREIPGFPCVPDPSATLANHCRLPAIRTRNWLITKALCP